MKKLCSFEMCAGAGGQALGLEKAGFSHSALIENDSAACETLRINHPRKWNVIEGDMRKFNGKEYRGIDLLAGGVPCPPFTIAGKQLGANDERDLFPEALRLVKEMNPKAVLLENVAGLSRSNFLSYRKNIIMNLNNLGFCVQWKILNASCFEVPQLRPRFILVALKKAYADFFVWPKEKKEKITVGEALYDLMREGGWPGAKAWKETANSVAPTIVGGSKKHGGPDLGPTRAKEQWGKLQVNGHGIADSPPEKDFPVGKHPKLTVRMAARIQGFPDSWKFSGKKTAAYRQVGNAFPPPVARAVGISIKNALNKKKIKNSRTEPQITFFTASECQTTR